MSRKAKTMKERAAEMGISEATLRRRLAKDAKDEPPSAWRERKERAEALKAERFLEMLDGHYLPLATVEEQQGRIGLVCNALLRAIESELPPLMAGLSAAAAQKKAKAWTVPWAEKLKDAREDVWKAAEQEMQKELRGDLKKVAAAQARKRK